MKRLTLTIVVLLSGTLISIAQECNKTLTGKVIDFHDGVPLKGATITYNNKTIVTDDAGNYSISSLCPTSYAFTISHKDCNSQVVTIDIEKVSAKTFYLEHHLNELQEVEVSGKTPSKTTSSQEETISENILEKYSSASLGDALREITGVSSLNTGSTIVKPIIQGLSGSRVLIMNNGVRMQDMEWGDEHAPNVDINSAGKVTVVKGAAALRYGGDAIGGVIVMEPNNAPAKDTLMGKTSVTGSSNGRGGAITSELIKGYESGWFVKGQGTFKRFGDVEAPDYVLSNTGISEIAASLAFGVNKFTHGWDAFYSYFDTEIGVLTASHIGNVDDLIVSINSNEPNVIRDFTYDIINPKQEVKHHLGRLRYFKRFEELGKLTVQYDFQLNQRLEFDIRQTAALREIPSLDLELTTHTFSSDFKFDSKSDITLDTGVLLRYQENFADPSTGVRRLIPDYDKYDAGAFIAGEYVINEDLVVDAGVRYDYSQINAKKFYLKTRWEERGYDQEFSDLIIGDFGTQYLTNPKFDYHSFSATTGLNYQFKDDYELRFNYALAQRAPNPAELFSDGLHHSAARIELGDLRIEQETSHKVSLSAQKNGERWGWEIAPYANFVNDYILLEPTNVELSIRGAFPVWEYRQTNVRLLGADAKLYTQLHSNWRTDHSFSIVKGIETENDTPLINLPAANLSNKVTFTKQDWLGLEMSLESQYVFRQNEFPPNIRVFSPQAGQDVLLEINTPPDAYHLLHANADIEVSAWNNSTMKIGATVSNILNKNYRNYLNRQRFFADEVGRNFILRLTFNY
ncbi:TonB-dependent receptor [Aquimarina spongiae]|uniref:Iron complex outermembrane recepter protein n=1 Tax=Aquimarina spongiae TaxID=570521 RepID=A0A1M6FIM4_9FLAO|nr:TonB-dependent receptor [Aquimarina spongiae]SHI97516.1 iron complex outermembrane recepter protein [Aquimarina spongiae]